MNTQKKIDRKDNMFGMDEDWLISASDDELANFENRTNSFDDGIEEHEERKRRRIAESQEY